MAAARDLPQASITTYAPRLRTYNNALLTPVLPSATQAGPLPRTTKRGTTIINYAEDGFEDYDDDDDDTASGGGGGRRRPTGLRSLRRDDSVARLDPGDKFGKEASQPVDVQGMWRDWMAKGRYAKADAQNYAQAALPLTLVPIRIDLDIPSFVPAPAFPLPPGPNVDPNNPLFRPQDPTVPYRLRDTFLWNLHETLITTDAFAQTLVQDLDLPNRQAMAAEISKQIRTQLEEYAGVALHPLFHTASHHHHNQHHQPQQQQQRSHHGIQQAAHTPGPRSRRHGSSTPAQQHQQQQHHHQQPAALSVSRAGTPSTPARIVAAAGTPPVPIQTSQGDVTATASPLPRVDDDEHDDDDGDDSPDDTYRCIINLNINLSSQVYTDKFEWSLLHPPGTAEAFAKQTCADLGLVGEWVPAITHAIYEAVLRLKKEACESGGLVSGWALGGVGSAAEYPNDAAPSFGDGGAAAAGWRYDPEHLADEWEPRLETLSKEEIEKREGDRERQIRRLRRETARFSSNAGMAGGVPVGFGFGGLIEQEEEQRMYGRGERGRKKRRFRSLSPLGGGRAGTPGGGGGRYTPDVGGGAGGGYGGGGTLAEHERMTWRCSHCQVWGTSVWAVRDGPKGPRTLCNNCGFIYERDRKLPRWAKNLHLQDLRQF